MPDTTVVCDRARKACLAAGCNHAVPHRIGVKSLNGLNMGDCTDERRESVCCVATGTPERIRCVPALVRDLIRIGTGELEHVYAGVCPDAVAGRDSRDEHCPACRVLMEADRLVGHSESGAE
jgi:hypothetical protein